MKSDQEGQDSLSKEQEGDASTPPKSLDLDENDVKMEKDQKPTEFRPKILKKKNKKPKAIILVTKHLIDLYK